MTPQQRARIIAEWRGLPDPAPAPERLTTAARVLDKVMATLGLEERLRAEEVLGVWQEMVGDFISAHASPIRLQEGTLFVQVLQPTMHYELDRVWKPRILEKLQIRFGKKRVRAVRFCLG